MKALVSVWALSLAGSRLEMRRFVEQPALFHGSSVPIHLGLLG